MSAWVQVLDIPQRWILMTSKRLTFHLVSFPLTRVNILTYFRWIDTQFCGDTEMSLQLLDELLWNVVHSIYVLPQDELS